MSRTHHDGKNRRQQRERNIRVRGIRRGTPDMHRLARVLIAIAQAEAEAAAEAEHRRDARDRSGDEQSDEIDKEVA